MTRTVFLFISVVAMIFSAVLASLRGESSTAALWLCAAGIWHLSWDRQ